MNILLALILGLLSGALIFGALFLIKNRLASGIGSKKTAVKLQIEEIDKTLLNLEKETDTFVSKSQLETVAKLKEGVALELEQTKSSLEDAEVKLEAAQKNVVAKESQQQELKVVREEEEAKLGEIASLHATLSSESLGLEKELADSMKHLDSLQTEVELTEKQKAAFGKLSEVLSATGERMRELISEYDSTNQKLQELMEQYKNLEDEYTRLVEQQLSA